MKRNGDKDRSKLRDRFSIKSSVQDFFCEKPNIEITDNTQAIVEGCRGVVEYSSSVIRVNLGDYTVAFVGRGMNLKCISPTSLVVEGFFLNIEFSV